MFGRRTPGRRVRRGTFSGANVRNALIAGAGMLAWKWWRNRQASTPATPSSPPTNPASSSPENAW
jgi:hypothetical protein